MYQAGTLSGNPLAMTAGIETLKALKGPGVYEELERRAAKLADGLGESATAAGVPVYQTRVGSMLCLFFTDQVVVDYDTAKTASTEKYAVYFQHMLEGGVYLAPSQFETGFISLAHSDEDIEASLRAANAALPMVAGI